MSAPRLPLLPGVVPEGPCWGELAQLVTHHRLGHIDGHVLATIVDGDGVTHHVRDDRRAARPGLDHSLLARGVEGVHLLQEVIVHERTLLQTTRHEVWPPRIRSSTRTAGTTAAHDHLV